MPALNDDKIVCIMQNSRKRGASHLGETINNWEPENMQGALCEWEQQREKPESERLGIRTLSRAWSVPYATLRRRIVNLRRRSSSSLDHVHQSGRRTVIPQHAEEELAKHIRELAGVGFPLTGPEVRKLAFEYASQNGYIGFSERRSSAGYYWLEGFMKRWPELSKKKPENLSCGRAMAMNKPQVFEWFDKLGTLMTNLGIKCTPSHIWNVDETGCQNIHVVNRVIGERGVPTYNITAVEKGETSTALITINAVGQTPPPMIIHKGKKIGKLWRNGAMHDTLVRSSENGWINKELFLEHGQAFVKFLQQEKLMDEKPHILIMDQHFSHVYNLQFLKLMKANNVHVFALPSHTSHWLQPLDRGVFKSFKNAWSDEMRVFTRNTAGRKLEKRDFFLVFNKAWSRSMTVVNAQGAFRGSGIFPFNPNAIPKNAFLPSTTSERPLGISSAPTPNVVVQNTNADREAHCIPPSPSHAAEGDLPTGASTLPSETANDVNPSASVSSSGVAIEEPLGLPLDESSRVCEPVPSISSAVSFSDLMPLPKRDRPVAKKPRARLPSYELTDTSVVTFVEKKLRDKNKTKNKSKALSKTTQIGIKKKSIGKSAKTQSLSSRSTSNQRSDCNLCGFDYGDQSDPLITDAWTSCQKCHFWWHETCSMASGSTTGKTFTCENCGQK